MPEDHVKYESFTVIYIEFLLVYNSKYYLQAYLDNCAYEFANRQLIDCLDENAFED